MNGSFFSGVNGIKTQSLGVDITANNIANVNTTGYKRTSSEFADIFYKRVASQSANPTEAGVGSVLSASKVVFEQGSFKDGESEFDVALAGRGFFGVIAYNGSTFYTRSGEFMRDAADNLVDANGYFVLGTMNPNLESIIYSQRVSDEMGTVNGTTVTQGYAARNPSADFSKGTATSQTTLKVPTNLYYYPEVTTQATFRGILDGRVTTNSVVLDLTDTTIEPNAPTITQNVGSLNLKGTLSATMTPAPQAGDTLAITLTDANGNEFTQNITLDANLSFDINNINPAITGFDKNTASIKSAQLTQNGTATDITLEDSVLSKNVTSLNISGTATSGKAGDKVTLILADATGNSFTLEATLDENLAYSVNNATGTSGVDLATANIASATLATTQTTAEDKVLGIRVYNTDGSVGTLRYNLQRDLNAAGTNIVYNVVAQLYDEDGTAVGGENTGQVVFNEFGALLSYSPSVIDNPKGSPITLNLGTPLNTTQATSGWDGIYLQLGDTAADSVEITQNGTAEGFFSQYSILEDGSVVASFSNGRTLTVAKLALYNFINEQGLANVGANNFVATANSGAASFIYDKNGELVQTATFRGNLLEQSNTDLSVELTNLIVLQRAFEASSKSITTSDDMVQTAIGLRD